MPKKIILLPVPPMKIKNDVRRDYFINKNIEDFNNERIKLSNNNSYIEYLSNLKYEKENSY